MPCKYDSLSGDRRTTDLDLVVDIVRGYSAKRPQWAATLIFDPESRAFIELRDSPPDVRGNSEDEAEEVDAEYMVSAFGLEFTQISSIVSNPYEWKWIDQR